MARRPTSKQSRIIKALIAKLEPEIAAAFMAAMRAAQDNVDYAALIKALDARDVARAVSLLEINQGLLYPLQESVRSGYVAGGASVAAALPMGMRGSFGFNGRHERAERIIAKIGADLVTGIAEDTIQLARSVILQGMVDNITSREVARNLVGTVSKITGKREGGILGLDAPRAHRLQQVTAGMKTPEGVKGLVIDGKGGPRLKYKVNAATERRILAAYKRGEAVSPADRAISERQLSNKLLKERGETIARDQAHTAQAAGRREAYSQVLERDDVKAITKKWQHGLSREARPHHEALDGTVMDFNEDFDVGGVMMSQPHDPRGGPAENLHCRCFAIHTVILERD